MLNKTIFIISLKNTFYKKKNYNGGTFLLFNKRFINYTEESIKTVSPLLKQIEKMDGGKFLKMSEKDKIWSRRLLIFAIIFPIYCIV